MSLEDYLREKFEGDLLSQEDDFIGRLYGRAEELFALDKGDVESFSLWIKRGKAKIANPKIRKAIEEHYRGNGYEINWENDKSFRAKKVGESLWGYISNYGAIIFIDVWSLRVKVKVIVEFGGRHKTLESGIITGDLPR